MAWNWNPISWVTSAYDWTVNEVSDALGWSGSEIVKLAGWSAKEVEALPRDVVKFITEGLHALSILMHRALHEVWQDFDNLGRELEYVGYGLGQVAQWVGQAESWLESHVEGEISAFYQSDVLPVAREVDKLAHQAVHLTESALKGLEHDVEASLLGVISPLAEAVTALPATIEHDIANAVSGLARSSDLPDFGTLWWLVEHGPGAIEWVIKNGPGIADLLAQASEWLIWLAANPPAAIGSAANDLTHVVGLSTAQAVAGQVPQSTDALTSFLDDLLGR